MAAGLAVSRSTVSDMENLRTVITLRTIDALAPMLGMTPAQVLAELDAQYPHLDPRRTPADGL